MRESELDSPLGLIRKKEQELAQRASAARREAEAVVAKAREQAGIIKEIAEREGAQEAEAYYRQEIARAEEEAAEVRKAGQDGARQLRETGRERLGRAAEAIVSFILPKS